MNAQAIIERHRKYGFSDIPGEWAAVQHNNQAAFMGAIDAGDVDAVDGMLAGMFRGPLAFGFVSLGRNPGKDFPHMLNWRIALWAKVSDNPVVERLAALDIGNPLVVPVQSVEGALVPVMIDTPRFDCYAGRICRVLEPYSTVLEIGGGYGGTALQILRTDPTVQVVLCDLPETLYLAWYWLHSAGVNVAWHDEDTNADVVLLPASELETWTDVDLVFSAHSLSGMGEEAVAKYMTWLEGSGAGYLYHDDVVERRTGVWLTDQFPEILVSEFNVPSCYREVWREHTPWSGLTDHFSEFFYEREP